ncbi:VTT domain-containing protein [Neisseriaceae bacterium JH1-16]|nr:VTT domain-containing protein [Neisseriaceae bacterium JH1-16]
MDIAVVRDALARDATWVVFLNVLLQQLGLPVPAVPTLLIAGSVLASPGAAAQLLAVAVIASLIADALWYRLGRAFGYRVLGGLCRLSLNPGSCVAQTESRFNRWGAGSLLLAKFIPGFSTVAPPIAGALRMPLPNFLAAAGVGAALWAGSALAVGWLGRDQLLGLLTLLSRNGGGLMLGAALVLGLWLAWKGWQRYRFERLAAIPHITPAELAAALRSATPPLLLDFRSAALVAETGAIPGATLTDLASLAAMVEGWPKHRPIVTLCACPGAATAVQAAHRLKRLGFQSVRPLDGDAEALLALVSR